ncbi:MAG: methylmalonyl Co-A mutase-associated GTPase MeaB [Myxococcales bacterium]|nr:methylmalonyl Co-A mutase-associated GTPase MeaB [Myxococcales bacterium]
MSLPPPSPATVVASAAAAILAGNVRAGSRLIRLLDDRDPIATEVLRALYPHTGRAQVIGITGNPGSGKSTLTNRLISLYRRQGLRVGVIAVDPSSPYSGGAILGDRIRMMEHFADSGVFIRSLATRGALGGLSRATSDAVHVLDAMGYQRVLVETVGVGQDEIDIMRTADTTVVVLVPGLGDDIQAIKAGILEIADVFVVNKADLDGAERTEADLRGLQMLMTAMPAWLPPIVRTVAARNDGLVELAEQIAKHAQHLTTNGNAEQRYRQRARFVVASLARDAVGVAVERWLDGAGQNLLAEVASRRTDPYEAAHTALAAARSE